MAQNIEPVFVKLQNVGRARLTAANTASDGSGTTPTLFTPGANGSLLFRIRCFNSQAAAAASSAMVIRFFMTDAAGTNPRLIKEVALAAATRTVAVVGATITIPFDGGGLFVPTGCLILVIQSVYAGAQDQMDYVAEGGDY